MCTCGDKRWKIFTSEDVVKLSCQRKLRVASPFRSICPFSHPKTFSKQNSKVPLHEVAHGGSRKLRRLRGRFKLFLVANIEEANFRVKLETWKKFWQKSNSELKWIFDFKLSSRKHLWLKVTKRWKQTDQKWWTLSGIERKIIAQLSIKHWRWSEASIQMHEATFMKWCSSVAMKLYLQGNLWF